jgi:hypothetical protein
MRWFRYGVPRLDVLPSFCYDLVDLAKQVLVLLFDSKRPGVIHSAQQTSRTRAQVVQWAATSAADPFGLFSVPVRGYKLLFENIHLFLARFF